MNSLLSSESASPWRRKKTYLWLIVGCGVVDGLLLVFGVSHPQINACGQVILVFALNVVVLGWCYVDAGERMIPISGILRFVMLFAACLGVPWYFLRSRGLFNAAKGGFGIGLFALWFVAAMSTGIIGMIGKMLLSR